MSAYKKVLKWKIIHDGYLDVKVVGDCMEPLLFEGDVVRIFPISKRIENGDILVISSDNYYKIHRVVKVYGNLYITKGDNMYFGEKDISEEDIIGVYNGKNPHKKIIATLSYIEMIFFRNNTTMKTIIESAMNHLKV